MQEAAGESLSAIDDSSEGGEQSIHAEGSIAATAVDAPEGVAAQEGATAAMAEEQSAGAETTHTPEEQEEVQMDAPVAEVAAAEKPAAG